MATEQTYRPIVQPGPTQSCLTLEAFFYHELGLRSLKKDEWLPPARRSSLRSMEADESLPPFPRSSLLRILLGLDDNPWIHLGLLRRNICLSQVALPIGALEDHAWHPLNDLVPSAMRKPDTYVRKAQLVPVLQDPRPERLDKSDRGVHDIAGLRAPRVTDVAVVNISVIKKVGFGPITQYDVEAVESL